MHVARPLGVRLVGHFVRLVPVLLLFGSIGVVLQVLPLAGGLRDDVYVGV